jgi:hypothetical protein
MKVYIDYIDECVCMYMYVYICVNNAYFVTGSPPLGGVGTENAGGSGARGGGVMRSWGQVCSQPPYEI